ncbi:MAG: Clp protease ClpP [Rikenellaceae bacterium]
MNALDSCVIDIEGVIGVAEEWQFERAEERVATYEKFRECVAQIEALEAQHIVVNIRSTGGDVNDAMLIYEALSSLSIPITTRCYGYVASAATVIAQAASEGMRQISANALYLVHNSTCAAEGNASDLSSRAELLIKTDECLAELYARRSSRSVEEFKELMSQEGGNGRWLTAQEAIDLGLADTLVEIPSTESSESDGSVVKNLIRRLGSALGITPIQREEERLEIPQNDYSVLHGENQTIVEQMAIQAFEQQQSIVKQTLLKQYEDPTLMEVTPNNNHRAYNIDAQSFRR